MIVNESKQSFPLLWRHLVSMVPDVLVEKLIEEVRKKQYLYDPRHRCYKDQALVKNTWTQIAIQLGFKDGKDNLIIHDQRHGTTWIQLNIY